MSTVHETVLVNHVHQCLLDPEYVRLSAVYLKGIAAGKYDQLLVDAVFQNWKDGAVNVYDTHAFMMIHAGLLNGTVASCMVPLGYVPSADKETVENNKKLSKLPDGFNAVFEGGPEGGCDGMIKWDFEIGAHSMAILPNGVHQNLRFWIQPRSAQLEVGSTKGSRTLMHVRTSGCVGRWPYTSTNILLLFDTEQMRAEREVVGESPCTCPLGIHNG